MHHPVIIIGAGPGGLTLALKLAQFGIRALVIDKELSRSPFTKALTLQPRTLEVLDDLGLLDLFVAHGNVIDKTDFFSNGSFVGSIQYGNLPSKCGCLLSITQPDSGKILEEAAAAHGIEVLRGVECIDVLIDGSVGCVKVKNTVTGKEETLKADYIIASDGGRSFVRSLFLKRNALKLTHEFRYDSNFIMGDFEMNDYPFPRNQRNTYFKNNAIFGLIPMVYPSVRVVAFGLRNEKDPSPKNEEFDQMAREMELCLDMSQGKWLSRFYPSRFMLDRFRIGPLFFVGDAAHIISPIGAQGMNLSIEDGYNLAWKLGMVLARGVDSSILDSYQQERMASAKLVLEETDQLHKKLSSSLRNLLFRLQLKLLKQPSTSDFVLLKQTQFYIDYPSIQVCKKKKSAFYSGGRLINGKCLRPERTTLFDHLAKDHWTVLINGESAEAVSLDSILKECKNQGSASFLFLSSGNRCEHPLPSLTLNPGDPLCERLKHSAPILVISPDKYVFRSYSIQQWKEEGMKQSNFFSEVLSTSRSV